MANNKRPRITTAIPNNPFYTPNAWQVCGNYLNYIVGCGICVTTEGTITTWDDGCGVCCIVGGNGICATNTAGVVEICNTGILGLSVGTGLCSTGGCEPLIYLDNTPVIPGEYPYPSITVDSRGRITAAISRPPTIRCDVFTQKGDLLVGEASQVGTALPIGPNNSLLVADSTCALGMDWKAGDEQPFILKCCLPSKGYLVAGSAGVNSPIALPPGVDGQALIADSTQPAGMSWQDLGGTIADPQNYTGAGEVVGAATVECTLTTNGNPSRCRYYMVSVSGDTRTRDGTVGTGVIWVSVGVTNQRGPIGYTTSIYTNEYWPFSTQYIFGPFLSSLPQAFYFGICQTCSGLNAGIRFNYKASIFGF